MSTDNGWPQLPYMEWKDTYQTLHMWTQIVGKVRLTLSPWLNHAWHATFYVTARGLTTSRIPYGARAFQMDFDFFDHVLRIGTSEGAMRTIELKPQSVADFYREVVANLDALGIQVRICGTPNEVVDAIAFDRDETHAAYDGDYAQRCWRIMVSAARVLQQFRAGFIGKSSPVHMFWGSFDLATTRFSGRKAPAHPGGVPNCPDWVMTDAYSHEVSSCGFWPGNDMLPYPLFYAYAYPVPSGYAQSQVKPRGAFFEQQFGEFVLPYDVVRQAAKPDVVLMEFLQSTYEATANLANWDRAALEYASPPRR